eukprot:1189476-Lingulodinium_polyedra.AAC.1
MTSPGPRGAAYTRQAGGRALPAFSVARQQLLPWRQQAAQPQGSQQTNSLVVCVRGASGAATSH